MSCQGSGPAGSYGIVCDGFGGGVGADGWIRERGTFEKIEAVGLMLKFTRPRSFAEGEARAMLTSTESLFMARCEAILTSSEPASGLQ